jgi:hypothetical protein
MRRPSWKHGFALSLTELTGGTLSLNEKGYALEK